MFILWRDTGDNRYCVVYEELGAMWFEAQVTPYELELTYWRDVWFDDDVKHISKLVGVEGELEFLGYFDSLKEAHDILRMETMLNE